MEFKKVFITNKGIIIIALLCIIQLFILSKVDTSMEGTLLYYNNYMNVLEGPMTEKSEKYIEDEKGHFSNVKSEYEDKQQLYMAGKISYSEMSIIEDRYVRDMIPYVAFKKVLKQQEHIKSMKDSKNQDAWYVNDIGINHLIYPEEIYSEKLSWLFMLLTMIVLVVTCVAYEEHTGMDKLSNVTLLGRKELFKDKLVVCGVIVLSTFAISNLSFLLLALKSYKFSGTIAPANSLRTFSYLGELPIWVLLLAIYLMKFLVMILAAVLTIIIAKKVSGIIKKIAIAMTIIIVPLLIWMIVSGGNKVEHNTPIDYYEMIDLEI